MILYLNTRGFIQTWLPLLLRQEDKVDQEVATATRFCYTTAAKGSRIEEYDCLPQLQTAVLSWALQNPEKVFAHHVFDVSRMFRKERAYISNPDLIKCYIVATEDYRLGRGDGMATTGPRSRFDFVQMETLPDDNDVVQLKLIFTYKWHDRPLGTEPTMETDFVFVQELSMSNDSPFRLFDFRRLVDKYAIFELSCIMRNRWALTNFSARETPSQVRGRKATTDYLVADGVLIWRY